MKTMPSLSIAAILLLSAFSAAAQEKDQNGVVHAWSGPSDRYTVVDFAAVWCRPCWTVLPRLETWAAEHPGIRVIVVSVDEKVDGRNALVEKLNLTIPVLWDENRKIVEHYRPEGMPATYVLDTEGKIVYQHVGSQKRDWDALKAFLDEATSP